MKSFTESVQMRFKSLYLKNMKTKQETLAQLQEEVALVVQISNEIINGNEAERYVAFESHELKDRSKQYFFYFKIYYFDLKGNDITHKIATPKNFWRIDDSMQIAVRDLQIFEKIEEDVLDEEGNPTGEKQIKMDNAVKLLRQWINIAPYPVLISQYALNLDQEDKFFDLDYEGELLR